MSDTEDLAEAAMPVINNGIANSSDTSLLSSFSRVFRENEVTRNGLGSR